MRGGSRWAVDLVGFRVCLSLECPVGPIQFLHLASLRADRRSVLLHGELDGCGGEQGEVAADLVVKQRLVSHQRRHEIKSDPVDRAPNPGHPPIQRLSAVVAPNPGHPPIQRLSAVVANPTHTRTTVVTSHSTATRCRQCRQQETSLSIHLNPACITASAGVFAAHSSVVTGTSTANAGWNDAWSSWCR